MDQNWEENQIRELFVELRKHDDARAPDFEAVWAAAAARARREHRRSMMRLTGIGAVFAVLGMIFGLVIIGNRTQKTLQVFGARSGVGTGESPSFDLPWKTSVLICEWRSPTDFLMQSPAGISTFSPTLPPKNK
jgi:hypothetical protein